MGHRHRSYGSIARTRQLKTDEHIKQELLIRSTLKACPYPELGDCRIWNGNTDADGYGRIYLGHHQTEFVHRAAFRVYTGKEAEKLVLHKCGVYSCCEPTHLYEGDNRDNMNDSIRHGTFKPIR